MNDDEESSGLLTSGDYQFASAMANFEPLWLSGHAALLPFHACFATFSSQGGGSRLIFW